MATLRTRAFQKLCNLSSLRRSAVQATGEPALSSSNNINNPLRAIGNQVMHASPSYNCCSIRSRITFPIPDPKESHAKENEPGRRKRPPADLSVLFPGRDNEHWLVVMEPPKEFRQAPKDGQIKRYIKCLSTVLGSEEEAIKAMYSISVDRFYGFGCQVSEDVAKKLRDTPGVWYVWQDSYVDKVNKDYGGEWFIDGKVVPRPPEREKLINGDPGPSYRNKRDRASSVVDLVLDEERVMED